MLIITDVGPRRRNSRRCRGRTGSERKQEIDVCFKAEGGSARVYSYRNWDARNIFRVGSNLLDGELSCWMAVTLESHELSRESLQRSLRWAQTYLRNLCIRPDWCLIQLIS